MTSAGTDFDAGRLGLGDARSGLAQVDDLEIEACGIDGVGELLLGGDADGATGVVEGGRWLSCEDS